MKALTECLILACLSKGDRYGYEISQSIKAYSGGCFRIPEGSMYPTLYRMLDRGYITSYNSDGEKRQLRIYYQITPAGRDHLKALMDAYGEAHNRLSDRPHRNASPPVVAQTEAARMFSGGPKPFTHQSYCTAEACCVVCACVVVTGGTVVFGFSCISFG